MHHENESTASSCLPTSTSSPIVEDSEDRTYKQRRLQMKWNLSSVAQYSLNQGLKLRLKYFLLPEPQWPHSDRNELTAVLKKMQKIWITGNLISPQIWEGGGMGVGGGCPTYRKLNKYTQQTLHLNSLIANICCLSHICFILKTGRWLEDNKLFLKIENGVQLARFSFNLEKFF